MDTAPGGASDPRTHFDDGNRAWDVVFRVSYFVVRRLGLVTQLFVKLRVPTFDNEIGRLDLVGRQSGRPRPVLLTVMRLGGNWYVGHPNGQRAWLANLAAMPRVELMLPRLPAELVRPVPLTLGPERDAVIVATATQQPIIVRWVYRAAQRHILRAGIYFRLDRIDAGTSASR